MTGITRRTVIAALIAATFVAAVCGGDGPTRPRTVDVGALTFDDVQQKALAAVQRPGQVYHLAATSRQFGDEDITDAWLDLERQLARRGRRDSDEARIYHDGRIAMVVNERFYDAPWEPRPPQAAATFATHLNWILTEKYEERSLREAVVSGEPAIEVRVSREYGGDYTGIEEARIYLDESFLPLKMKLDPPDPFPGGELTFESEFLPRDALPADLFSVDALRALAAGPIGDVEAARDSGLDVFWLGTAFEGMVLRDESRFSAEGPGDDGQRSLSLSYGPADPSLPAPCAHIYIRPAEAGASGLPGTAVASGTVEVAGETATIYRGPVLVPPGPAGSVMPPQLTPVPEDTGEFFAAVIETETSLIEVIVSCGPVGSNVYRSEAAFLRLVQALRRFDGA